MDINKYNLYDYKSYERISKIMEEKFSWQIKNEPCFNHGEHDDIYSIYSALKNRGWPKNILLDECELKLRQNLIKETLKLFNLNKEIEILELRKKICSQIPDNSFNVKSRACVISLLQEEVHSLSDNNLILTTLDTIIRLRAELRAVLEMKGVSFEEEDRKLEELRELSKDYKIANDEYFNSDGFNGDI